MNRIVIIFCLFLGLSLSSCVLNPKKPGRIFMPDMTYSNAYETYATTDNPNYDQKDTMTALLPVEGTIPFGFIPEDENLRTDESLISSYVIKNLADHGDPLKYQENYDKAGAMLKNPLPLTEEVLKEAKPLYAIHCGVCHGDGGAGDGSIVVLPDGSDGPYTAIPPAYTTRLPTINDGQMFYSITYGRNMMGGYGAQTSAEERWKLVHYIKDLVGMYSPEDFQSPGEDVPSALTE